MIGKNLTYISLFSSAGVGCYGFKQANFECIATNELIERRLNIQKVNKKCKLNTGYILGDIKEQRVKQKILNEIKKWKKRGNDKVDVLIATPPCQGMSVANHKKNEEEIVRNSLVVESISIIKKIKPRIFIFENVPAFMKTACTSFCGEIQEIGQVIEEELGKNYCIYSKVINFKNYGSNSSRKRTLVIGIENSFSDYISPIELFPKYTKEKLLEEVIGNLPNLEWGEFAQNDFYHQFRTYPEHMRNWITNLEQGKSAFDNINIEDKPHKIVNGEIVINQNKNGDKYTRQEWNKVGPCIHTRNDQLASQNTIHPTQDRVFSIRELMEMMTIPRDFRWIDKTLEELNELELEEKIKLLKSEEINIRQSIGEAVPTNIFYQIAQNINEILKKENYNEQKIKKIVEERKLTDLENLKRFVRNSKNIGLGTLSKIVELSNTKRTTTDAYFTYKFIITEIIKKLPDFAKDEIHILEPSVGIGNFIPLIAAKYEHIKKVIIDVVDIDKNIIEVLKILIRKYKLPKNIKINYICDDYLLHQFNKKYQLIIGNPPFTKLNSKDEKLEEYLKENQNQDSKNLVSFFIEKSLKMTENLALIVPKSVLNTPEYKVTREILDKTSISHIIDNGELGFKGVLVETICFIANTVVKPNKTVVKSLTKSKEIIQKQKYITDNKFPYWIIYRDAKFDKIAKNMKFGIFEVFRDRQITNDNSENIPSNEYNIRVIKSRNISDDGKEILNIENYDAYISAKELEKLSVKKYIQSEDVYLTPNMTYLPRVMKKPKGMITNRKCSYFNT